MFLLGSFPSYIFAEEEVSKYPEIEFSVLSSPRSKRDLKRIRGHRGKICAGECKSKNKVPLKNYQCVNKIDKIEKGFLIEVNFRGTHGCPEGHRVSGLELRLPIKPIRCKEDQFYHCEESNEEDRVKNDWHFKQWMLTKYPSLPSYKLEFRFKGVEPGKVYRDKAALNAKLSLMEKLFQGVRSKISNDLFCEFTHNLYMHMKKKMPSGNYKSVKELTLIGVGAVSWDIHHRPNGVNGKPVCILGPAGKEFNYLPEAKVSCLDICAKL